MERKKKVEKHLKKSKRTSQGRDAHRVGDLGEVNGGPDVGEARRRQRGEPAPALGGQDPLRSGVQLGGLLGAALGGRQHREVLRQRRFPLLRRRGVAHGGRRVRLQGLVDVGEPRGPGLRVCEAVEDLVEVVVVDAAAADRVGQGAAGLERTLGERRRRRVLDPEGEPADVRGALHQLHVDPGDVFRSAQFDGHGVEVLAAGRARAVVERRDDARDLVVVAGDLPREQRGVVDLELGGELGPGEGDVGGGPGGVGDAGDRAQGLGKKELEFFFFFFRGGLVFSIFLHSLALLFLCSLSLLFSLSLPLSLSFSFSSTEKHKSKGSRNKKITLTLASAAALAAARLLELNPGNVAAAKVPESAKAKAAARAAALRGEIERILSVFLLGLGYFGIWVGRVVQMGRKR